MIKEEEEPGHLSYQSHKWYVEVWRSCGDLRHQNRNDYCVACKMNVQIIEMAVEDYRLTAAMDAKRAIIEGLQKAHADEIFERTKADARDQSSLSSE